MSDESSDDRSWLLQPPEAGTVRMTVEMGDGVELNDEQRAALDSLVSAFYEGEVSGFALPPRCRPFSCEPNRTQCLEDYCGKLTCDIGFMPTTGLIG